MHCLCSLTLFSFFFFKQKTAYEMRISDWSSDVCSSDLIFRIPVRHEAEEAADRGEPAVTRADRGPAPMFGMVEERAHLVGRDIGQCDSRDPAAFSLGDKEIGRESCRESVCQYV